MLCHGVEKSPKVIQKTMRSLGQVVPSDFQIKTKSHAHIAAKDRKECLKEQKIGIEFILSSVDVHTIPQRRVYSELRVYSDALKGMG